MPKDILVTYFSSDWVRVSKKYILVQVLSVLIMALFALSLSVIFSMMFFNMIVLRWFTVVILLTTLVTVIFFWRSLKTAGYHKKEEEILLCRGIFLQRIVVVPYSRVQLVEITRNPLHRIFDLANLHVITASNNNSAIVLGLNLNQAIKLRGEIMQKATEYKNLI